MSGDRYPMTRFVVDAGAVLHLASAEVEVSSEHARGVWPTLRRVVMRIDSRSAFSNIGPFGDLGCAPLVADPAWAPRE